MNSIGPECTPLKWEYDKCFNLWFREHYLKGDTTDFCADLFKKYQNCVKNAMKERNMDVSELEESILGTANEKQAPPHGNSKINQSTNDN